MRNEDILAYWVAQAEPMIAFSPEQLTGFGFQPATAAFLTTVGLPAQAGPYLNFAQPTVTGSLGLQHVSQAYGLRDSFAGYIAIGFDGAGNPLVVNTHQQDQVEWLDHEQEFSPHYLNTSLPALAACLVAYDQFVHQVQQAAGEEAYLEANFTDEQFETLRNALTAADLPALEEGRFWEIELSSLLADREDNQASASESSNLDRS